MSRRGPKPASPVERLRTRYWYAMLKQRGYSRADLTRLLLERHEDPGKVVGLPTIYKIAAGERLASEPEVFAIDRRIPGSRKHYDALLWRVLLDPPMNAQEAERMVEAELVSHGLRRASARETRSYLGETAGIATNLLYWHFLRASVKLLSPLEAMGIAAALYREADLGAQPEVQVEATRVFDEFGDPLLASVLGIDEGSTAYSMLLDTMLHASRPSQRLENHSRLINQPVVPTSWTTEFVYGDVAGGILRMYEVPRPIDHDHPTHRPT